VRPVAPPAAGAPLRWPPRPALSARGAAARPHHTSGRRGRLRARSAGPPRTRGERRRHLLRPLGGDPLPPGRGGGGGLRGRGPRRGPPPPPPPAAPRRAP